MNTPAKIHRAATGIYEYRGVFIARRARQHFVTYSYLGRGGICLDKMPFEPDQGEFETLGAARLAVDARTATVPGKLGTHASNRYEIQWTGNLVAGTRIRVRSDWDVRCLRWEWATLDRNDDGFFFLSF